MAELHSFRETRWDLRFKAADQVPPPLRCAFAPRVQMSISDMRVELAGSEFDYVGVVVQIGPMYEGEAIHCPREHCLTKQHTCICRDRHILLPMVVPR